MQKQTQNPSQIANCKQLIRTLKCDRHPRKNSGDEFVENLKATLNKIKNGNKHIIICGDFSYDLLK